MLDWITIDEKYLDYLRKNVDSRIPRVEYGPNHYKPFFGVLFETGDFAYVSQVSHPQPRHASISGPDFVKVYDGAKMLCVVNLNYMFPIPKKKVNYLDYRNIQAYRSFVSEKEKNDYIALLKREMSIMQTMGIEEKAKKVYKLRALYPESFVAKRCLDFTRLEEACKEYHQEDS